MDRVLLTTLWEGNVVPIVVYKLNPAKIILVLDDNTKRKDSAVALKKQFPKITFDSISVHEFDVPEITEKMVAAISKEDGNEVYLHLSEGRKTMFLGGVFAASLLKGKVKGAYYLREDNNELMSVPLMDMSISSTKKKILKELSKGNRKVEAIRAKIKSTRGGKEAVHRSLVYAAIKDMIDSGYITDDWELTDAGRILVM